MIARPIPFSGPMMIALLADAKSQTRRIVKLPADYCEVSGPWMNNDGKCVDPAGPLWSFGNEQVPGDPQNFYVEHRMPCPYGLPGDRLWVKEALRRANNGAAYVADGKPCIEPWPWRWKGDTLSSRFCPRNGSRLTLEVVGVRVERLQAITPADVLAEGVRIPATPAGQPLLCLTDGSAQFLPKGFAQAYDADQHLVALYAALWESINGAGSWALNPWVWVVEFKRVAP